MPRFTKDQMLDELRTIFLFEADHILMGAGREMAEAFIGFGAGDAGEYCHRPPSDVDLKRFLIAGAFEQGYDYAFQPSLLNSFEEGSVQDLIVFMHGTPRVGGIDSGGQMHDFMTPNGLCQTVVDAVHARWRLECEAGIGPDFTTRELALLADMTEGAVRNALADKSDNGLRAVAGTKNPVLVEHAEALRWLKGRRGFIPWPERACEDRFLTAHLQNIQSSEALGALIGRHLWNAFESPKKAPSALGWSTEEVESWQNGTQIFSEDKARQLAVAFDFDVPLFVGKALEVTLRRSLSDKTGERS